MLIVILLFIFMLTFYHLSSVIVFVGIDVFGASKLLISWLEKMYVFCIIAGIHVGILVFSIGDRKWCWGRSQSTVFSNCYSSAVCYSNVGYGYMAVFYAQVHAPQQVFVSTHPFSTSPPCCPLCIWSFVQSPH